MAAYLIAEDIISDPDVFEDYKRAVLPSIERHGGRFLSRGGALEVLEAGSGWTPERLVVVAFPDMAALKRWYDSPDYAEIRTIRLRSAVSTLVALDAGTSESQG